MVVRLVLFFVFFITKLFVKSVGEFISLELDSNQLEEDMSCRPGRGSRIGLGGGLISSQTSN